MKVYNQDKTEILTNYDLRYGKLVDDMITQKVPEVKAKEVIKHYELIGEYSNGGKAYREIIDEPAVEYQPERIVKENIFVYVPYTEEELKQKTIDEKIKRLEELTKDFAQVEAGLVIDDIEERKSEFRTLLNEIRVLQGKQPRVIK